MGSEFSALCIYNTETSWEFLRDPESPARVKPPAGGAMIHCVRGVSRHGYLTHNDEWLVGKERKKPVSP